MTPEEKKQKDKEIRDNALDELATGQYGKALLSLLDEKMEELDTVSGIKTETELLARQEAIKIIKLVFQFLKRKQDTVEETGNNNPYL